MKCPQCGKNNVYEVVTTTATSETGLLQCLDCRYVFKLIYCDDGKFQKGDATK